MIESARLFCKQGEFSLSVVVDGKHYIWPLTKSRALYLMESGMEALRESENPDDSVL